MYFFGFIAKSASIFLLRSTAASKVFETLSLSEYTLGSEFTISMYMDSTVEVTEEKSITFHSFELKKPNLVGKISTSYATLTTNELGEQVATYNVSPGWGTMKMNVAGWTSDLTVFEISFTPTKDVRLCFELNGKHGGHIDFAGGETHVHTVDVSGYPLAESFTIRIYFDAEVEQILDKYSKQWRKDWKTYEKTQETSQFIWYYIM